jgi:phage tail sheath protein FI
MPVAPAVSYPGVYIQEVESDVRTIVPVETATTAFIGRARRGPVDKPVICNSYADFQRVFGGLWLESSLGYAVNHFFLNGGSKAVVVRLFNHPDKNQNDKASIKVKTVPEDIFEAANAVLTAAEEAAKLKDVTGKSVKEAAQNKVDEQEEGPAQDAAQQVLDAINQINDEARKEDITAALNNIKPSEIAQAVVQEDTDLLILEATHPGGWGNKLCVRITHIDEKKIREQLAQQYGVKQERLFNLTVHDRTTGATETFPNVTVVEGPRRLDKVLKNESEMIVVQSSLPAQFHPFAHPTPQKADWWDDPNACDVVAQKDQATDGEALTKDEFVGDEAHKKGIYALEHADIFNLLCIPPYEDDTDLYKSVLPAAATYCEKRRAMLLVDPPKSWIGKDKAKEGFPIEGLSSDNAAVFFPRIQAPDPLRHNHVEAFAPGGAIAGIFARTDATRGVWKSPAGLEATLRGVVGLTVPLTDAENGELNPLGINCLRQVPAAGYVVWGARTIAGDDRLASQWKYIAVRRTALYIEESLYRGTQWAVFEPNDEPLWSQLRLNIGVFMHGLFRQGAFQGQSPKDAYFVKCDSTTTTQADIDRGIVNIIVGFAPLKPAEFVVLYIQQIAGQLAV